MSLLTIIAATGMVVLSGTQTTPVSLSDLPSACINATDECGNTCSKGDNGGWACTKMACVTKKDAICTKSSTEETPTMCTMQYDPVCATKKVQCIKAPCDPVEQTYGNACMATAAGATIISQGECASDEMIVGGDKDEHGCIGSAGYVWNDESQQCVRPWEERQKLVNWAHSIGMTKYDSWSDFAYDTYVTREQAAKMIMTVINELVKQGSIDEWMIKQSAGTCEWSDAGMIDSSLMTFVHQTCSKGLMYGANGKYHPTGYMTDSDMRVIVVRLSAYVPKLEEMLSRVRLMSPKGMPMTRGELISAISTWYEWMGSVSPSVDTLIGSYVLSGSTTHTLTFDATGVHAKFCNMVSGSYDISGDMMTFGPMVATQMYCMDEGLMKLESSFGSLKRVQYSLSGSGLLMKSDSGVVFEWIKK